MKRSTRVVGPLSKSSLVLAVVAALGCAVEVDDSEAETTARSGIALDVGEVPIDFPPPTGEWVQPFVRTEHKLTIFDSEIGTLHVGEAHRKTCWLSGIDGNLYHPVSDGAGAMVTQANTLAVFGVPDSLIVAKAVCINRVAGRTYHSWDFSAGGSTPIHLGPVTANRQCFLTEMVVDSSTAPTSLDGVRIYAQQGDWWLMAFGNAIEASAVCLDLPSNMYAASGVSGTAYLGLDEGDNACGLTGIYGPLTAGKFVSLSTPPTLPGRWLFRVSSGNSGGWACMREKTRDVAPAWPRPQ